MRAEAPDVLARKLAEAGQGAQGVLIIVEDGDFHRGCEWQVGDSEQRIVTRSLPIRYSPIGLRKKENRARQGPGLVRQRGGADDHLPEGNYCLHCGCHLGGWGNRLASQHAHYARRARDAQREALHVSHAKICARKAEFTPGIFGSVATARHSVGRERIACPRQLKRQKFQRCALATRKSRKACTRATDLSSSG